MPSATDAAEGLVGVRHLAHPEAERCRARLPGDVADAAMCVVSGNEKAKAKKEQMKGKVKETVGRAVSNEKATIEGRGEKARGDARQAKEKAKDVFKR